MSRSTVLFAATILLGALAACSPSSDGIGGGASTGTGFSGPGPGGPGTGTGFGQQGSNGSGVSGGTCSADLQSVVAADGSSLACPPDQGCLDGACIPACDAAAGSKGSIGCDFYAPDPPFVYNGFNPGLPLNGP